MLLNSEQIKEIVGISEHSGIAQVGIDLSVQKIERIEGGGVVLKNKTILNPDNYIEIFPSQQTIVNNKGENTEFFGWFLYPGEYSITFNEKITLPENRTAFILHRSSIWRQGNLIMSPVWDPGFTSGENYMATTLIVNNAMYVEQNARLAQVVVHENNPAPLYDGQWQGKGTL